MNDHVETTESPSPSQVLDEIDYFRARIREAARDGRDAAREAREVYAPFLLRRRRLLAALHHCSTED